MKTITIKAYQTPSGYKVHYFSNTCQVSIGSVLSREQWEQAISHPRANMICTGLEPSETEEDSLLLGDEPKLLPSPVELDGETNEGVQAKAREFDALMLEIAPLVEWANIGTLETATQPSAGENNLGSIGIQGNIAKSKALSIIRRTCARKLQLDPEQIGKVSYRAEHLETLQSFAASYNEQPF